MFYFEQIKHLCSQCRKAFSQKAHLARHQRAVHEGIKYPCGQCGKQFSEKGDIARHQREVHEGIKYPCGQCCKEFSRKEILLNIKGQYMTESNPLAEGNLA